MSLYLDTLEALERLAPGGDRCHELRIAYEAEQEMDDAMANLERLDRLGLVRCFGGGWWALAIH